MFHSNVCTTLSGHSHHQNCIHTYLRCWSISASPPVQDNPANAESGQNSPAPADTIPRLFCCSPIDVLPQAHNKRRQSYSQKDLHPLLRVQNSPSGLLYIPSFSGKFSLQSQLYFLAPALSFDPLLTLHNYHQLSPPHQMQMKDFDNNSDFQASSNSLLSMNIHPSISWSSWIYSSFSLKYLLYSQKANSFSPWATTHLPMEEEPPHQSSNQAGVQI